MTLLGKTPDGKNVQIDVDRLVVSRLLLQANSGGGKSWALRRLLEQTHGKVQHLVLDVEGEFHTLRERFDYVLAAKTGGDTLADVRSAPLLARRLLELGTSAILDLYELKSPERIRFVRLFLEALIDAPRALWHPALVVVDEAHLFCPQVGEAESAAAVKDLMTRGRKRGFCGVLATQRLSKLHKDAAAECNCKLVGRASLDVDLRRAGDELGFSSREDLSRLRAMPVGRFFAFGPGLSDQVVEVQIGDVQTTHPRAGSGQAPVPPPREKVQKVLAQLADLPKEADEEARTLAQAKAEIVKLRRELATANNSPHKKQPEIQRVEVPVMKDSHIARIERLAENVGKACAAFADGTRELAALGGMCKMPKAHQPTGMPAVKGRTSSGPPAATDPREAEARIADLGKCERAILAVLAQHQGGCRSGKLALLAGYTWSGGFRNSLSTLRTAGLIEGGNGEEMRATEVGLLCATGVEPLPAGDALVQHWLQHPSFGACERKIIGALIEAPAGLAAAALAQAAGYEWSGGFRNSLSTLRTAGVLVGKNSETMRLSDDLLAAAGGGA